jgi:hypothetical protein
MNFSATRFARPLVIAVVPLLLVAGASFAAGGVPALVPSFDSHPTADQSAGASAGATDTVRATHAPEASEAAETAEPTEATETHDANATAETSDEDSQGDDGQGDSDGDHGSTASAGASFGHGDGHGTKPTFGPSSSGAPSRDGGHH